MGFGRQAGWHQTTVALGTRAVLGNERKKEDKRRQPCLHDSIDVKFFSLR